MFIITENINSSKGRKIEVKFHWCSREFVKEFDCICVYVNSALIFAFEHNSISSTLGVL